MRRVSDLIWNCPVRFCFIIKKITSADYCENHEDETAICRIILKTYYYIIYMHEQMTQAKAPGNAPARIEAMN